MDKQDVIESMLNDGLIDEATAMELVEYSLGEVLAAAEQITNAPRIVGGEA